MEVTNLTAYALKHRLSDRKKQFVSNINYILMIVLILFAAFIDTIISTETTVIDASPFIQQTPSLSSLSALSILNSNENGSSDLILTLIQQHQQQQEDLINARFAPQQQDGNIFSQLNSFIQTRQRNATDIAGNIFFKYYNT